MDLQKIQSVEQREQLERMLADKFICKLLGVELTNVGQGSAQAELTLRPEHMNGIDICQGGVLFSLADYALAAAFNYTRDAVVSLDMSISYCKSVKTGRLIAEAHETERTNSTALGDVVVRDEEGATICHIRGRGYIIHNR